MGAPVSGRVFLREALERSRDLPLAARSVMWTCHSLCDAHGVVSRERLRVASGVGMPTWEMTVDWLVQRNWLCPLGDSFQATPPRDGVTR